MKRRKLIITGLCFFLSACGSRATSPASAPASVTSTPRPLQALDLQPVLFQASDFPENVYLADTKSVIPPMLQVVQIYPDIVPAQKLDTIQLQSGSGAIGGAVVYLYTKSADQLRAYQILIEKFGSAQMLGTVGDQALINMMVGSVNATEKLSGKTYTLVDIAFRRCAAVGYIRLRTDGETERLAKAYAQKLDNRLKTLVC